LCRYVEGESGIGKTTLVNEVINTVKVGLYKLNAV
jgi:predicted ATPase